MAMSFPAQWPLASEKRLCSLDLAVQNHLEVAGKKYVQNSYYQFDAIEKGVCRMFSLLI
jgi:hypothetical protein